MSQTQQPVYRRDGTWVVDVDEQRQTAASSITTRQITTDATRTVAAMLTTEADHLRHQVKSLGVNVDDVHQRSYMNEWQVRTQERGQQSTVQLLEQLAELGFAWRDIARLVGVSVPALQKWRKGSSTTPENRLKLASLLAGCDFVVRHRPIEDIGQWFEMPLIQGIPVTPIDMWASGDYPLVFEYALQHSKAEHILDRVEPGWRAHQESDFETFVAGDGELSVRLRER